MLVHRLPPSICPKTGGFREAWDERQGVAATRSWRTGERRHFAAAGVGVYGRKRSFVTKAAELADFSLAEGEEQLMSLAEIKTIIQWTDPTILRGLRDVDVDGFAQKAAVALLFKAKTRFACTAGKRRWMKFEGRTVL